MTKKEFTRGYLNRSKINGYKEVRQFFRDYVVLECICDFELCNGWAVVVNQPLNIKGHMELYSPS